MATRESADLVIVGAGTVGGWASVFARELGAEKVIVLERDVAGAGASSRAAGMVRAQGGSPDTVRLGAWSIAFYEGQAARYGTDSGFRGQGYLIAASTTADERAGRERVEMQRATGLDSRWVGPTQARSLSPTLADAGLRGASYVATDGWLDPLRNVRAYGLAMQGAGVTLREHTDFLGLRTRARKGGGTVTGVETSEGTISTTKILLTGGPSLRAVANAAGARAFVGGARHQVAVTQPHEAFEPERFGAMVFDIHAGMYWRPEDGGLLWGMSNPTETPGPASEIDWSYLRRMRRRLNRLVPATRDLGMRKVWAATIEYTPDHLPLLGPLVDHDGREVNGASIAGACGHGMMWGPAVSQIGADLALTGKTEIVERVDDLRMDRFDERGRSPFVDPVALPFPAAVED